MNTPTARNILSLLTLIVIAALTSTSLAAQALPICSTVSADDASSILGAPATKIKDPSGCGWEDATHQKRLNVAYVNVPSMFDGARTESATTGKTEDEAGLGEKAFSTIPTKDKGGRVAVYCLKGSTVLILDLEETGAAARLPQIREVMRKVAAKV